MTAPTPLQQRLSRLTRVQGQMTARHSGMRFRSLAREAVRAHAEVLEVAERLLRVIDAADSFNEAEVRRLLAEHRGSS